MGAFAEKTNVEEHLSFADQGKQNSVFRFCLQKTFGSLLFLFSEVAVFDQFRFQYMYIDIDIVI
jgi:hypothetical protein